MIQTKRQLARESSGAPGAEKSCKAASAKSKISQLEAMLRRPEGATIAQLAAALDWQAHSVRGAMSGFLKKKRSLKVTSDRASGAPRVYRIAE